MKVPLKTHGGKHYLAQKIIALIRRTRISLSLTRVGSRSCWRNRVRASPRSSTISTAPSRTSGRCFRMKGCSLGFGAACRRSRSVKWSGTRQSKPLIPPGRGGKGGPVLCPVPPEHVGPL